MEVHRSSKSVMLVHRSSKSVMLVRFSSSPNIDFLKIKLILFLVFAIQSYKQ